MNDIPFEAVASYFKQYQTGVKVALSKISPSLKWTIDPWTYQKGEGGGITMIAEDETIFERAAVNVSSISGQSLKPSAAEQDISSKPFQACGVSIIIHPHNPYVPTTHANFRLFLTYTDTGSPVWWFGGGFDLTPYYPFDEDCITWHQAAKKACDTLDPTLYLKFKTRCDDYFYLKHRDETRGIGGIFFDELNQWPYEDCMSFIEAASKAFLDTYIYICSKRRKTPYSDHQRSFQCYRRGRYVEFNLLYDRGTHFGLDSGGRTESILASLPPIVHWHYNYQPTEQSLEARLVSEYLKPRDWLNLT